MMPDIEGGSTYGTRSVSYQNQLDNLRTDLIAEFEVLLDKKLGEKLGAILELKLDEKLGDIKNDFLQSSQEVIHLKSHLADARSDLADAQAKIVALQESQVQNTTTIESLQTGLNTLCESVAEADEFRSDAITSFRELESKLEERTNRQLRQTLVIKGLPEEKKHDTQQGQAVRNQQETWQDTRNLLANYISQHYSMTFRAAYSMFERVHRSHSKGVNGEKEGRRDIFAALSHWDDCERLVNKSSKLKSRNGEPRVSFHYKYGPLTTQKRNEALKMRKELMASDSIFAGKLKYPAKLMVCYGENDHFVEHVDFSETKISHLTVLKKATKP